MNDSLFDVPPSLPPHQRRSKTSRDAALSIAGAPWENKLERIFLLIQVAGQHGRTADECGAMLGEDSSYATAPAITELVKQERVKRTDRTRPTRRGREANVYVAEARK